MRKLIFASMASLFIAAGCNTATDDHKTDNKADNKIAAGRSIVTAFQTGDMSGIDKNVADNFVDHTDRGDKTGRDSLKAMINNVRTNFKDMKMETVSESANDNYLFQLMRYTGTSNGSMGMPAGPYDMKSLEVSRFDNGKIVEHWAYMETQEMMKMMNAAQPPIAGGKK